MGRRQLLPALLLGACAFLACPGDDDLQAFAASRVGRRGALLSVPGLLLPALTPEEASADSLAVQAEVQGWSLSMRAELEQSVAASAAASAAAARLSVGVPWLAGLVVIIAGCIAVDKAIFGMINGAVIPEAFQNQVRIIEEARKDLERAVGKVQKKLGWLLSTIAEEAFLREPRMIQKAMHELGDVMCEANNCLRLWKKAEDLGEQFTTDWTKAEEQENMWNGTTLAAFGVTSIFAPEAGMVAQARLVSLPGPSLYGPYEEHIKEQMSVVKEQRGKLQEATNVLQRLEDLQHYAEDLKEKLEGRPEGMDGQAMADAKRSLQQAVQEVKERLWHVEEIM